MNSFMNIHLYTIRNLRSTAYYIRV